MHDDAVLCIRDLAISFPRAGARRAVDGVGFSLPRGRVLSIIGESGSGKSLTALAVLGLLPPTARLDAGAIVLAHPDGPIDVASLSPRQARRVRGRCAAMIFQEPMSALNPVFTVGEQVAEAARLHSGVSRARALALAIDALAEAGITDPGRRALQYPHELSGGLRQRVCIAMALACHPALLIADEPTTALDASVQARILGLLAELRRTRGLAIILITHALGIAESFADAVAVMDQGRIVEFGPPSLVFGAPAHPYTRALIACSPRLDHPTPRLRTVGDLIAQASPVDERTWWPRAGRTGPSRLVPRTPGHWVAELGPGNGEVPWVKSDDVVMHNASEFARPGPSHDDGDEA